MGHRKPVGHVKYIPIIPGKIAFCNGNYLQGPYCSEISHLQSGKAGTNRPGRFAGKCLNASEIYSSLEFFKVMFLRICAKVIAIKADLEECVFLFPGILNPSLLEKRFSTTFCREVLLDGRASQATQFVSRLWFLDDSLNCYPKNPKKNTRI